MSRTNANPTQVVVDPTINPDFMEMYADEESRGGVLEPEGIVNIKYRKDKQLETMARLDATYGDLRRQIADKSISAEKQNEIKAKMTEREQLLLPVYSQISLQFADLHDRAGRMEAKNTIRHPIQWKNARRFFYWRLRRRLNEEIVLRSMATSSARGPATRSNNLRNVQAWTGISDYDRNDRAVATWFEENKQVIKSKVEALKVEGVSFEMTALLGTDKESGLKGLKTALSMMPVEEREEALKYLKSA